VAAKNQTIIKRKKKVMGGGHHGGAWKVAYADFVTAMMAFFLMMWLLNAVSEDTKKGLADYFDSRIPISRSSGGGQGAFKGDSLTDSQNLAHSGKGSAIIVNGRSQVDAQQDADPKGAASPEAAKEAQGFNQVESTIASLGGESAVADKLLSHIRTRTTPEGLVIEISDSDGAPLFAPGDATPTPMLRALVGVVAGVAQLVTNEVAITGHTDATPFGQSGDDGNWRLSADRAQTARRLLTESGLDRQRIAQVTGRAATRPLYPDDPADPRNRRVEITLLRNFPVR
jgi:chemotaxis protein MotB